MKKFEVDCGIFSRLIEASSFDVIDGILFFYKSDDSTFAVVKEWRYIKVLGEE
jgi:hypothetical protein